MTFSFLTLGGFLKWSFLFLVFKDVSNYVHLPAVLCTGSIVRKVVKEELMKELIMETLTGMREKGCSALKS